MTSFCASKSVKMMSLDFNQRLSIDDRCIEMEYGNANLEHSFQNDLYDEEARPRLHTWPASDFFGHSYSAPLLEAVEPVLLDESPNGRPPSDSIAVRGEKEPKKANSPSKSPATQHQSPRSQQPRRKLTTHKLSAKSYVDLITEAIVSSAERRMTLADIYKWMVANVPCFKQQANVSASSGWKNAVRHTLSLHKRFKRVQRGRLQKPAWWTIQEQEGGASGVTGTIAGRSPATEFNYQRRHHSESCFHNIEHETFAAATSYPDLDVRRSVGGTCYLSPEPNCGWTSSTVAAGAAAGAVDGYKDFATSAGGIWDTAQHDHVSSAPPPLTAMRSSCGHVAKVEQDEDGAGSLFESYVANGDYAYLTRTASDASAYGSSPYRVKALTQAYSSINQEDQHKSLLTSYEQLQGYNNTEMDDYGQLMHSSPVNNCQPVLVQTEKGAVAPINVPMPLKVYVRQQAEQHAQTMGHLNHLQYDLSKSYFHFEATGLPQDLLSVQVDSQVQCNVAEVLAYEMKASTNARESREVNDLYDLLTVGCALD